MKKYFIQFDFWNKHINKYFFGIVDADLSDISLPDLCRKLIRENVEGINPEDVEIKVTSFNCIEV